MIQSKEKETNYIIHNAHRHIWAASTEQRPLGVFNWWFNLILMFLFLFPSGELTQLARRFGYKAWLMWLVTNSPCSSFGCRWLLLLLYGWVYLSVAIVGNSWIRLLCICYFSVHSLNDYFRSFFFVQLIKYWLLVFYFEIMTVMTNNTQTHTHTWGNKTQRTKKPKKIGEKEQNVRLWKKT